MFKTNFIRLCLSVLMFSPFLARSQERPKPLLVAPFASLIAVSQDCQGSIQSQLEAVADKDLGLDQKPYPPFGVVSPVRNQKDNLIDLKVYRINVGGYYYSQGEIVFKAKLYSKNQAVPYGRGAWGSIEYLGSIDAGSGPLCRVVTRKIVASRSVRTLTWADDYKSRQ